MSRRNNQWAPCCPECRGWHVIESESRGPEVQACQAAGRWLDLDGRVRDDWARAHVVGQLRDAGLAELIPLVEPDFSSNGPRLVICDRCGHLSDAASGLPCRRCGGPSCAPTGGTYREQVAYCTSCGCTDVESDAWASLNGDVTDGDSPTLTLWCPECESDLVSVAWFDPEHDLEPRSSRPPHGYGVEPSGEWLFQRDLLTAMAATQGWNRCWWNEPKIEKALREGQARGWLHRPSTTQVEWTTLGVESLDPELVCAFHRCSERVRAHRAGFASDPP